MADSANRAPTLVDGFWFAGILCTRGGAREAAAQLAGHAPSFEEGGFPCFQRREFICQADQPLHHFGRSGVRNMNETVSAEFIGRRLDGLQNNLSGLNRRMVTLESNLTDRWVRLKPGWLGSKIAPISLPIALGHWQQV